MSNSPRVTPVTVPAPKKRKGLLLDRHRWDHTPHVIAALVEDLPGPGRSPFRLDPDPSVGAGPNSLDGCFRSGSLRVAIPAAAAMLSRSRPSSFGASRSSCMVRRVSPAYVVSWMAKAEVLACQMFPAEFTVHWTLGTYGITNCMAIRLSPVPISRVYVIRASDGIVGSGTLARESSPGPVAYLTMLWKPGNQKCRWPPVSTQSRRGRRSVRFSCNGCVASTVPRESKTVEAIPHRVERPQIAGGLPGDSRQPAEFPRSFAGPPEGSHTLPHG